MEDRESFERVCQHVVGVTSGCAEATCEGGVELNAGRNGSGVGRLDTLELFDLSVDLECERTRRCGEFGPGRGAWLRQETVDAAQVLILNSVSPRRLRNKV